MVLEDSPPVVAQSTWDDMVGLHGSAFIMLAPPTNGPVEK
jgi:hypothetical protein